MRPVFSDIKSNEVVQASVLLGILVLLLFSQGLAGRFVLLGGELDFVTFRNLSVAREAVDVGNIPLWTERIFGGFPLLTNPELALCYPPTWIAFLLPVHRAIGCLIALHVLLSCVTAYLYFHSKGLERFGCFTAAATWGFCGYALSHSVIVSTLFSLAWTPLIFLFVERSITGRKVSDLLALGVIAGLQILGGDVRLAVGTQAVAVLWTVGGGVVDRSINSWRSICATVLSMAALGFGLSAVLGIPFLQLAAGAAQQSPAAFRPMHFILPGGAGGDALFLGVFFLPLAVAGANSIQGRRFCVLASLAIVSWWCCSALAAACMGFAALIGIGVTVTSDYVLPRLVTTRYRSMARRLIIGFQIMSLLWAGGQWLPKTRLKNLRDQHLEEARVVKTLREHVPDRIRIADMTLNPLAHNRWMTHGVESISGFSRCVPQKLIEFTSLGVETEPAGGGAVYSSFTSRPSALHASECNVIIFDKGAETLATFLDRELSKRSGRERVLEQIHLADSAWSIYQIMDWETLGSKSQKPIPPMDEFSRELHEHLFLVGMWISLFSLSVVSGWLAVLAVECVFDRTGKHDRVAISQ